MSRATIVNFDMMYKIDFTCGMRGHHVYKTSWAPVLNEKLDCKKDYREDALDHDKHSIGVYRKDGTFVDHVPIELSRLIEYFVKSKDGNFVAAVVAGPRKREVRLVVPANFSAFTDDLRVATVLSAEILKIKKKYFHFELAYKEAKIIKRPIMT